MEDQSRKKTSQFNSGSEALVQFHRSHWFATGAQNAVQGFQCGGAWEGASRALLNGNSHAMGSDGALLWDLGILQPGEQVLITLYTACGSSEAEVMQLLDWARGETGPRLSAQTCAYWRHYLADARQTGPVRADIGQLYNRSLLVFRLVSDGNFGSILAAPEIDEHFTRCGGYGYCWPRDAAYITLAYDYAGLNSMARQFYTWLLGTQGPDGSCQQRYYINGTVAPNWGLQLDEVGSVLWGMWQHFLHNADARFLRDIWSYVTKAVAFILSCVDEESGLIRACYDIWEERKGIHTYSGAAVWGGLCGAAAIAEALGRHEERVNWQEAADKLRTALLLKAWDKKSGSFYRSLKVEVNREEYEWRHTQGLEGGISFNSKGYPLYYKGQDTAVDCSLLGLCIPFRLLEPGDERIKATVAAIEKKLTSEKVGGLLRYEGDSYIGGNPWVITTLWLALYRVAAGDYPGARELLDWVVRHSTPLGLLPEQVDKTTGETAWVVPLTWSHAMFVLTVLALREEGELPA
ncbi:MAG TPA: glycoside hydrolase family 15 protein [Bacillota bacterium]|nr:glycoside hydrolase family 15 protein [Bacillota bacterium]